MTIRHAPLPPNIAVTGPELLQTESNALAKRLKIPLLPFSDTARQQQFDFLLVLNPLDDHFRIELNQPHSDSGNIYVDFGIGAIAYRRRHGGGRRQPLAKAIGIKPGFNPSVLDATAGLGRDAHVLATLGLQLHLVERSPIVSALLADGIHRAGLDKKTQGLFDNNMRLYVGDAKDLIPTICEHRATDVIYLDPMYPHRSKSALVKKEMRALRALVGDDPDMHQLLAIALRYARQRVVVKRPRNASPVSAHKPAHSIKSKNTRYDVYLN